MQDISRKTDCRKQDIFQGLYIDKCCFVSAQPLFCCRIVKLLEIFRVEAF